MNAEPSTTVDDRLDYMMAMAIELRKMADDRMLIYLIEMLLVEIDLQRASGRDE